MRKRIEALVMKFGYCDTKKFRYALFEFADHKEIRRIEMDKLNTTAAVPYGDGWEIVKEIR